jgi:hypothetical protein
MHDYGREQKVYLDSNAWDYSVTTGKYRNQFLGETKRETENTKDLDGNTGNLRVTGGQAGRKNSAQLFYGFMFLRMVSESRPWAISSLARRSNRASIS